MNILRHNLRRQTIRKFLEYVVRLLESLFDRFCHLTLIILLIFQVRGKLKQDDKTIR
jgi:hypothetical protein